MLQIKKNEINEQLVVRVNTAMELTGMSEKTDDRTEQFRAEVFTFLKSYLSTDAGSQIDLVNSVRDWWKRNLEMIDKDVLAAEKTTGPLFEARLSRIKIIAAVGFEESEKLLLSTMKC